MTGETPKCLYCNSFSITGTIKEWYCETCGMFGGTNSGITE